MADSEEYTGLVPDSDLDPPEGIAPTYYVGASGWPIPILPNDWVDLNETDIPIDPLWGSSFQVVQCHADHITVRMLESDKTTYVEVGVSPHLITNNYRRQPFLYDVDAIRLIEGFEDFTPPQEDL